MVKQQKKTTKEQVSRVIKKVWVQKANNNQMLITIPKWSGIKPGDYVEVTKV